MPTAKAQATKVYDVLHDFHTRIDDETGEDGVFAPGGVFDPSLIRRSPADVEKLVAQLLKGIDFHGPLIAEQVPPAAPEGN